MPEFTLLPEVGLHLMPIRPPTYLIFVCGQGNSGLPPPDPAMTSYLSCDMSALYCRSCRWSLIAKFDQEQRAGMTTTRDRQHSTQAAAADLTESAAEQGDTSSVLLLADVIEHLFPLAAAVFLLDACRRLIQNSITG